METKHFFFPWEYYVEIFSGEKEMVCFSYNSQINSTTIQMERIEKVVYSLSTGY